MGSVALAEFLAHLAEVRGHLFEHEVPDDVALDGDVEVIVRSGGGEDVGRVFVPQVREPLIASDLSTLPPAQSNVDRERLIQEMQIAEAQLIGWLVRDSTLAQEFLLATDGEAEEGLRVLVGNSQEWMSLLASAPGASGGGGEEMLHYCADVGLDRRTRNELVDVGMGLWRHFIDSERSGEPTQQAITLWTDALGEARAALIEGNVRLIAKVAAKHRRRLRHTDALRAGLVGFNRALDGFEPERGFQLSTYATWWIRQAVSRAHADHGDAIRRPVHVVERLNKARWELREHWSFGTKKAEALESIDEGVLPQSKHRLLDWSVPAYRPWPLIGMPVEEGAFDLTTYLGPAERVGSVLSRASSCISEMVTYLAAKEGGTQQQKDSIERKRKVFRKRLGIGMSRHRTLEEIGQDENVTRERIRQIEVKVFEELQKKYKKQIARILTSSTRPGSNE